MAQKPTYKPQNPNFSAGPTTKHKGWSIAALDQSDFGRSHRSPAIKAKLKRAIDETRELLEVPADYRIAIVPASDTGAVEMAMWHMLGSRPVDVLHWESFSKDWAIDAKEQLKLQDLQILESPRYGLLPDLSKVRPDADLVFPWNGTTSGVRLPHTDFIPEDREGITICDATSAAFAMPLDWSKLDVTTYSWQKVLGGEAQHGMLILSPHAVKRLEDGHQTPPLPKLFRMTKANKLNESLFEGNVINTPSILCIEDYLYNLAWVRRLGGLSAMIEKANHNASIIYDWIEKTDWVTPLAIDPATHSNTGVCMIFADEKFDRLSKDEQEAFGKQYTTLLAQEKVAYDINAYRTAPTGLRIWCGGSVEGEDLRALLPWLEWAWQELMH